MIHFPEEYNQKLIGELNSKTDLFVLAREHIKQPG